MYYLLALGLLRSLVVVVEVSKEDGGTSHGWDPVFLLHGEILLSVPRKCSGEGKVHDSHERKVSLHVSVTLAPRKDQVAHVETEHSHTAHHPLVPLVKRGYGIEVHFEKFVLSKDHLHSEEREERGAELVDLIGIVLLAIRLYFVLWTRRSIIDSRENIECVLWY